MQAMNTVNWMKKRHHDTAKLQYKNDPVQLKKLKALIYIFKKYDKDQSSKLMYNLIYRFSGYQRVRYDV